MTNWQKLCLAIGVVAVIIVVIFAILRVTKPHTVASEKKRVSSRLRAIGSPRGFRLLDNPVLLADKLSGWADHILIGYFGVLLVYDLCLPGEYYGEPAAKTWKAIFSGSSFEIDNPTIAAAQCEGRVRVLLKEAGIKTPVHRIIVLTGKKKVTQNFIKLDSITTLGALRHRLDASQFTEDIGLDVERTTAVLSAALAPAEKK